VFSGPEAFGACGYIMKGGGDGSNRDVTPRYVVFGALAMRPGIAPPWDPFP